MSDLASLRFTIRAIHEAYATGVTPMAVVAEMFRRLRAADDPGIFIAIAAEDELLVAARALGAFDPAKPMWGIPVAVKDNIDAAGFATTAACPGAATYPKDDAETVRRLRNAGALIIGKTNLDQFATGLVGTRTPYPVPRNPFDATLVPGGSSSGSAVAVALGIVPVALGTDTAGSGRVPAAFNNIVGLKPSLGGVSTCGLLPACRSLDCISVFAHTVEDSWATYAAMGGYDAADPFSRRVASRPAPARRLRVGVPREADRVFSDTAAREAFAGAVESVRALGVELVEVDLGPLFSVGALLYGGPWVAERYAAIRPVIEEQATDVLPVTYEIIAGATRFSAAAAFEGQYRLRELARRAEPILDGIDILCVPSVPGPVTLKEIEADPFAANARLGTYTNFVNLLDLCALAVPSGRRLDGLPAGVTLIARSGGDALLAEFGDRVHKATTDRLGATQWPLPRDEWKPPLAAEGIPIVVFGAHLSGLALNHELLRAGGVFVAEVATAPDYRLHLLDGGVQRPGLVRIGAGTGHAIAAEVWRLPPDGFGTFVAGIPAPLGIGTVRLADGSQVKGFLAEAEGVRDAPDISRFGGWRAYLAAARPKARAS